jgi:hypothetical protein
MRSRHAALRNPLGLNPPSRFRSRTCTPCISGDSPSALRRQKKSLMLRWQARRDLNPQPSDLESDALAVRATGLSSKKSELPSPKHETLSGISISGLGVSDLGFTLVMPLSPYESYDACSFCNTFSAEASRSYSSCSSYLNSSCLCTLYTETVLCLSLQSLRSIAPPLTPLFRGTGWGIL